MSSPTTSNDNSGDAAFSSHFSFIRHSMSKGELDVFNAEKYFSGILDAIQDHPEPKSSGNYKKDGNEDEKVPRLTTCPGASAGSRSAMLRKRRGSKARGLLRCSSCAKKNDVDAEENLDRVCKDGARSESSSDLFEIDSVSMSTRCRACEPGEASLGWSDAGRTAASFSAASDGSLERCRAMTDLGSMNLEGSTSACRRRPSSHGGGVMNVLRY